MRFGVLGPLAVWTSGGDAVRVPEAKVRALLAVLLVHEGRPVSVDRLVEQLWGERPPGNPGNTVQTKVSQLRRTLEAAEPGGRTLVVWDAAGYRLDVAAEAVDLRRFRELTARARASEDPASRAAVLGEALELWRGPVLADFADEPFAVPVSRRLDEDRLTAQEDLAEARLALGEHAALAGELGALVARHPLRERLRAVQLRALYRSGRQSEALAGYDEVRRLLADELGLEPGPELAGLQHAILRQDPALDLAPPLPQGGELPVPVTELLGRADAVREVRSLLERERLVTLTGPGGVGKTRLALETAARLAESTRDGVRFVELAGLDRHGCAEPRSEPEHWVPEAVADALGVRQDAGTELVERLADAVRDRELILVLDNCEPLVEPIAHLVSRLLRAAPGLRVLATSQRPLGVGGEVLWVVPPLGIPACGHLEPGRPAAAVLASVREFSAVRLFVARAAATAPGFALTEDTVAAVAAICRSLDGLPLALELAATRVRALGVHELLARLGDRFRLLSSGPRDAPARQRTLRAMLDWSWELLTDAERVVLRRLAVHAEGCTLDAAEAVSSGQGIEPDAVLDLLAGLVDRSLVVADDHGGAAGRRYRLLESVLAYGRERLAEAGERDRVRLRHARFHVELAERADPLLRGSGQQGWLRRLDAEAANVRAALDTLVGLGRADDALRLVNAMTWYWFLRGRIAEARRSLRAALAAPGEADPSARAAARVWEAGLAVLAGERADPRAAGDADAIADPAVRARAQWFLGYVLGTVGDLSPGQRLTRDALAGFRALGDRWGTAAALADNAGQLLALGVIDESRRAAEESAAVFHELGERWGLVQSAFALGALAQIRGDYADARDRFLESLRRARELGLWPEVSYQLSWLGRTALLSGDAGQARELHEQAMRLAAEQGFAPGEMYARTGLALGARREGALDEAERHLRVLLEWNRLVEFEPGNTLVLAELGFVAELRGDVALARRQHVGALAVALRGGDPRAIALAVEGLACADALAGDVTPAARLLGRAQHARSSVGAPLPPAERHDVDRASATARDALGAEKFAREHGHGVDLGLNGLEDLLRDSLADM
ncbi:BTAD domain-containing putative transcriptional regulator [Prauserella cavernicola]|uniref:Winged helix-turn-helix domain-containing protein n=1 Tax=Prauserella cavernicola TaxID=2800127 RepID=A0A934QPE8_9PSEU|nr:BTAD domain-containing putative transcriptional regulator [Prauserella cavernicola]MBK1783083.1 winged helix-turn-helix domain-containing protein [Prauserella cavernicola]